MKSSILLHIGALLCLLAPSAASKAGAFLARKSATRRVGSYKRLQSRMSELGKALGNHLHYRPVDAARLPIFAQDARELLRREANQAQSWDGANLLGSYADWVPDYVLVLPMTNDSPQKRSPVGHSVSEQTLVTSDGKHTVSQTTRCKDGNCETTNQNKAADAHKLGSDFGDGFEALGSFDAPGGLQDSMKRMGEEMEGWQHTFGVDPLKETLNTIFDDEWKRQHEHDHAHEHGDRHGMLDWDAAFGRTSLKDRLGSDLKDIQNKASNSETMESETRIENGKRVTRQKMCNNGHCKTVVTTEDLDYQSPEKSSDQSSDTASTKHKDKLVW